MSDSGIVMVLHALIIGVLLYVLMRYLLKQPMAVAVDRSILIAAIILVYMILFGHKLPGRVNSNIM
jgi:TRAP-type C4-dicarboxylate transport system permease small subunit